MEQDGDNVVSSLDGIGAYDHVHRSAYFAELRADPELGRMLPFVRLWYGSQSPRSGVDWSDDAGIDHRISKRERVEQGDLLAPLALSLAIDRALCRAQAFLQPDERMFAFLDDVYTIAKRDRAAEITAHVAKCIKEDAGVEPKLGKLAMWARNGEPEPPWVGDLLDGQRRPAIRM